MKAKFMAAVMVSALALPTTAQNYWVIETNPRQARETIVKIYDLQNQLVHEETLRGKILDARFRSDRKLLDRKLKEYAKQKAIVSARRAPKSRKS
jgi:hypothetical protein